MANEPDPTARPHPTDDARSRRPKEVLLDQAGLCAAAQADGVPCSELGRRCEVCEAEAW